MCGGIDMDQGRNIGDSQVIDRLTSQQFCIYLDLLSATIRYLTTEITTEIRKCDCLVNNVQQMRAEMRSSISNEIHQRFF